MKKDLFAIAVILFALILIITGTKIQSVEDYYLTHLDDIKEDSETVFLTVVCHEALKEGAGLSSSLAEILPTDGIILARTEYVLRPNDSVYDILDRAVRHNRIAAEYVHSVDGSVYVKGMGHLYEYDCGPLSGWVFHVNGVSPTDSCDRTLLSDGDEILWYFTCDLGGVNRSQTDE